MQYTAFSTAVKNDNFQFKISFIFAQNIDREYTLEPPLTSTHDLCFRAKIRKNNVYPGTPKLHYIKMGFKGVISTWACYPDEVITNTPTISNA